MRYIKNIGIPLLTFLIYLVVSIVCVSAFENGITATLFCDLICSIMGLCYYKYIKPVKRDFSPSEAGMVGLHFLTLLLCVFACTQIFSYWYYSKFGDTGMDVRADTISSDVGLFVIISVFIAPIFEEVMMRGIVFEHLRRISPVPVAAVISGLLFGLMHMTVIYLFVGTLFGIFMAIAYSITNRLSVCIVLHSLYNIVTIILGGIVFPSSCYQSWIVILYYVVTVAFLFLIYSEDRKRI